MEVIVHESKIEGLGVFATRDFKVGEAVIEWHPTMLTNTEFVELPEAEKNYVLIGKTNLLMSKPERYVNHSCSPNTESKNQIDIAIKNIKKGEEITTDYGDQNPVPFECNCGSKNCRKHIS